MGKITSIIRNIVLNRTQRYILFAIILVGLVWVIALSITSYNEKNRFDQSAAQAARLAVFFERHVRGIFQYGDAYLKLVRREYVKNFDIQSIRDLMEEVPLDTAIASHITIMDATGKPLLVSGHKIKPGVTAKDRYYFQYQQNNSGDQFYISLPHKGRNSGILTVRMVRRLVDSDGEFAGVIFIALKADNVTEFFNALDLGPKSSATLVGTDKKIRARSSYGRLGPGQDISGSQIWKELELSPVGLYRQMSVVDNITRYYAYRLLSDFPLIIAIGLSTEDIASDARIYSRQTYAIALLATFLVVITVILLLREISVSQKLALSESHTRAIVESVFDGIITVDEKGLIISFSSGAENIFEYLENDVVGRPISMLVEEKNSVPNQVVKEFLLPNNNIGASEEYREIVARRKNGESFPAEFSTTKTERNQELINVLTVRDLSEKKLAEKALFEARERAQVTLQSIGDAVISTNSEGKVEFLNSVAEGLTGWVIEEAHGRPLSDIFKIIDERTRETISDPVQGCLQGGDTIELADNTVLISRNGSEFAIEDSAAPIRDDDGVILGVVLVFKDVTESRRLSQKITHQAAHDALTGLINRQEFERRLARVYETAQTEYSENVLCFMDLDRFKLVNDTCGHIAGDELLRQIAQLMNSVIRRRDTVGRLGGDEFGLLMEHCSEAEASRICKLIINEINEFSFNWDGSRFSVGISIGLVTIVHGSVSGQELMQSADSACYTAKETGRNKIHVYREEDETLLKRQGEVQWAIRLPRALQEDKFRLYFQTIAPIQDDQEAGLQHFEVLLRMIDEDGELILPGSFLPAAERYNLATKIDQWVVEHLFQWFQDNPAQLDKLNICAINLSALSLNSETFLPFIIEKFEQYNIPPHKICFEITETVAISNLASATNFIESLKRTGCLFALDDFGSGLSSYAYLKNLQVDILKIDGIFVKDILDDRMDLALVNSITEIAKAMDKKTVAEFVESDLILDKVRSLGVDFAQGYGIAVPQPLDDLLNDNTSTLVSAQNV